MEYHKRPEVLFTVILIMFFLLACNSRTGNPESALVDDPDEMNQAVADIISKNLESASANNSRLDDSIRLSMLQVVQSWYQSREYEPVWSREEKWEAMADSLFQFIEKAEYEGLFPQDYHFKHLKSLKAKLDTDSLKRMDPVLWTKAELMLTDGFMKIIRDLRKGRLLDDSTSTAKDSLIFDKFYAKALTEFLEKKQLGPVLEPLQPAFKAYWELKRSIRSFVDSMDRRSYTYVTYPFKKGDSKDSSYFVRTLMKRLGESGCAMVSGKMPDSVQLAASIKKYQQQKGLKADGKYSTSLIRMMNTSDAERFKRIAITLDRYKQLPDKMPQKYIYVNLPSYQLQVWDHDTLALESRVICGRPETRTPVLTSEITDMVTYPTWTVPNSIIVKQYLPRLKNNPNYLNRLGLKLVNGKGQHVDPGAINWSRYSKGIPFRVMQNSGDNNALGVLKFNFANKYAVYLHDTNQRYLFKNSSRALSHGCVRVQEWQALAFYIARNDSLNLRRGDTLRYNTDSIRVWLARKERRKIDVKNKIPLYLRYFTCEGVNGRVKFYDDIYGEDKLLREKYFAEK